MKLKREQKYDIWKKIKHSPVIEEKSKMRSQKRICTPAENIEEMKRKAQKEVLIFRMHAVCIDKR